MFPVVWIGAACLFAVAGLLWKLKKRKPSLESFLMPQPPKDTVILHQFGPAPFVPSVSPFVIKLETYLRIAKIPYINSFDRKMGPKGKLPWIQFNNQVISDSQACIEFLNDQFGVNLNKKLTNEQLAVGHVMRRSVEEFLYWCLIMWRLMFDPKCSLYKTLGMPKPITWYIKRVSTSRTAAQGIGCHSESEVTKLMDDDLQAIVTILGSKQFLFADTSDGVTEFDCAVFGQLCQLIWQCPGTDVQQHIQDKFPSLVRYCERMKSAYWSDWNDRLMTSCKSTTATTASVSSSLTTTKNLSTQDSENELNNNKSHSSDRQYGVHDVRGVTLNARISSRVVA